MTWTTGLEAAAGPVRDLAAKCAAAADAQRGLDPQVVAEIRSAGFARHFVPAAAAGHEGGYLELLRAVATVAEGCTSAAWVAGLYATVARMAAWLPAAGQARLWADGPDQLVVGGLMPVGTATEHGGGWLLSGAWPYISGVCFSDWALLCAMARVGEEAPTPWYFAVPRSAYEIRDTWNTVGMRGTGSHTLVLPETHVDADLAFPREAITNGGPISAAACHQVPLRAVNGLAFTAPPLGAARAMLTAWSGQQGAKGRATPGAAAVLARSAGEIDQATLLLERAAAMADEGRPLSALEAARSSRDCALAAELVTSAVNRLFPSAGTSGQAAGQPLERIWRDVNTASTHLVIQFDPAAAGYAAEALGRG